MGISLRPTKSEVGDKIAFLGLLGPSPSTDRGMRLRAKLTPEKSKRWTSAISKHLQAGLISPHVVDMLIGKL